jgi:hypothetical protein
MNQRRLILWVVIVVLVIALGVVVLFRDQARWLLRPESAPPSPNTNALAIGSAATVDQQIPLTLQQPAELDGMSRAAVYALRTQAVLAYPQLLAADYRPWDGVFGQITDGKPWWGMSGQWYYGSGAQSIEGVSEETRFLLNPYLLVGVDFYGFSYFDGRGEVWNRTQVDAADPNSPGFPLTCLPERLTWQPTDAYAEIRYDVTDCLAAMNQYTSRNLSVPDNGGFDLFAYNARDLNLNFIYIDYAASLNITQTDPPAQAVEIPHYIHVGGSCGYEGGCNNMSPAFPPLDFLSLTGLPADLVAKLWQSAPASVDAPADMTFTIQFR